jgi:phage baseplate assembly protein V
MVELEQRLSDLAHRLERLLSFAAIAAVDYPAARVRVRFSETHVSGWLPWLTRRALGDELSWDAPEIGERVLVLAPSGTLESACVLPALYSDASPHDEVSADVITRRHSDGAEDRYDRALSQRTITLPDAGRLTIQIGTTQLVLEDGEATLTADEILLEGMNSVKVESPSIVLEGSVDLGGTGGKPVARQDDPVASGKITSGSSEVRST